MCQWNGSGTSGTNGGCIPGRYSAITTSNVGSGCTSNADCYSPYGYGACVDPGICMIFDCAAPGIPSTVCGTGNQCVDLGGPDSVCTKSCTSATECPTGSACADVDASAITPDVCWPACATSADCRAGETCSATTGTCI
jgi:hypothetical protein